MHRVFLYVCTYVTQLCQIIISKKRCLFEIDIVRKNFVWKLDKQQQQPCSFENL